LIIFFACDKGAQDKTIDLEQIRPKSDFKAEKKKESVLDSNEIFLRIYKNDSVDLEFTKLCVNQNPTFLSRFPNTNSGSRTLFLSDTTIKIQHEFYDYLDSNQMKNAFFNWLDCNGKDCRSIKLFEEIKIENTNLIVITTSKSIDIIRSESNLNLDNWVKFVRFSKKNRDFKYILFQKKNQKSKWFDYKDKLVPKPKK
jgi:hypothetical protein